MIDGNPNGNGGWAILGAIGKTNAVVSLKRPPTWRNRLARRLTFTLAQNSVHAGHSIGRFRLSATSAPRPGQGRR